MKTRIKLIINRVTLWIIALGPIAVDLAKQLIHLISHFFGGCTGV